MSPAQNFATYISTREINNASSSSMTAQFSRLIHMAPFENHFPLPSPTVFWKSEKKKKKKKLYFIDFFI
jgi:hypothetical protein